MPRTIGEDFLTGGVWTIPAGTPFLRTLASALAGATGLDTDREALANATIYLPNQRSISAFTMELHAVAPDGQALFMPDIRALGDLATDDPPPGSDRAFAELGPALKQPRRLGALMGLVDRFFAARGLPLPATSALSSAQELAGLLDQAALAGGIDWSKLDTLAGDSELARHWQDSVEFLQIVTRHWPAWLEQNSALDPMERRRRAAEAIAGNWTASQSDAPVIIAGSTGANAESRILMKAARALPRGAVVLQGLDTSLSAEELEQVSLAPNHPQHALIAALAAMDLSPGSVPSLGPAEIPQAAARRALINEALSPAELTGDWTERLKEISSPDTPGDFTRRALQGLDIIAARDETDEAMIAACLLRETLQTPKQTAVLISPDAGLSRRVSAHLKRWQIDVTPSEGTPLLRTPAGAFFDALLAWWVRPDGPVEMATLLHSAHAAAPAGSDVFERWVLRGARWWRDLAHLQETVAERLMRKSNYSTPEHDELPAICAVAEWFHALQRAAGEQVSFDMTTLHTTLRDVLEVACIPDQLWRGSDGSQLARLIDQLMQLGADLGPQTIETWRDLARKLASEIKVAPQTPSHPRLTILGALEARLQTADRIILAGLNENVWPHQAGGDTFLPRQFRQPLGLPPLEETMGLAAHDFASLACASNVTLIHSERREDAPAVASRWIWRLQTLVRGALGDDADAAMGPPANADPRDWVDALAQPLQIQDANHARPKPCPDVTARPKGLSVTRINTLQRDPYAIYAESVLGLKHLDPIDKPLDARERGTAIHAALEDFSDIPGGDAEDLLARLEHHLGDAGETDEILAGNRAVRRRTAQWYVDWFTGRRGGLASGHDEVWGNIKLPLPGGETFKLTAKADRIEKRRDGSLAIIDFKTGAPPSDKQIKSGLEQQMPLQALIAIEGGFTDIAASAVSELVYVAFKAKPDETHIGTGKSLQASPGELAATARDGLIRLLGAYTDAGQAYLSAPRVQFIKYDNGFNRLARRDEWSSEDGDE